MRRLESPETTKGGIFIRKDDRKVREEGEVLSVGPERHQKTNVRAGDRIVFERFTGRDIKWEGEDLLIMDFDNVIAVHEN